MGLRVGIDLGTTNSAVARVEKGKPVIIRNGYDQELTPSAVCFCDGEMLIGEEAYSMMAEGAAEGITAFKLRMGDDSVLIEGNGKGYSAQDLSAALLKHLIKEAEERIGEKITEAIITVPQYFDEARRLSTKEAGEACGIKILKLINEPTSAALYYGYNHFGKKTVMVYDLGGGTFDVNIINFERGKTEVISTNGNFNLGGKNWDEILANIACERFAMEFSVDPRSDRSFRNPLMASAEKVKKQLSSGNSAPFQIDYDGMSGRYTVTREEFRIASESLLQSTKEICDKALEDKGLTWQNIDEILLIGGSSRMPMVQEFLSEETGLPIVRHPDMELAVAKGAAIAADSYRNGLTESRMLRDVTAHSLGALSIAEDDDRYYNQIIIRRNTHIPCRETKPFRIEKGNRTDHVEVFALQGESSVPDECVAVAYATIKGFENKGDGVEIDITYSYDENGVVDITAECGGRPLKVTSTSLPDISWMSGKPSERKDENISEKNIVICIDLSRSMKFKNEDGTLPLDEAKKTIRWFVGNLGNENNHFALVGFGDREKTLCELTQDMGLFNESLDKTEANMLGRGTASAPIDYARAIAEEGGRLGVIVIMTDGEWEQKDRSIRDARECRKAGVPVFAVGFGKANRAFLAQISTVEKGALYTTIDRLGQTFQTIATAIKTDRMSLRDPDEE